MHKLTQKPEAILRCMKILGGTVAWSGFQIWMRTKATMSTAAITRHRITRHSLHWKLSARWSPEHQTRTSTTTHLILGSAPLQCQTQGHDSGEKRGKAQEVELPDLLLQGHLGGRLIRNLEQEGDDCHGHRSHGYCCSHLSAFWTVTTYPQNHSRLIQKHHLQVACVVKAPLRVGPSTEETPKMAPAMPCILGRCSSGTQNTKTTI